MPNIKNFLIFLSLALASIFYCRAAFPQTNCTLSGELLELIVDPIDMRREIEPRYQLFVKKVGNKSITIPLEFKRKGKKHLRGGRVSVRGSFSARKFTIDDDSEQNLQTTGTLAATDCLLPAYDDSVASGVEIAQSTIPVPLNFSSMPAAPATLYLNFGGGVVNGVWANQYSNITTPPFDLDDNTAGFSQIERDAMLLICNAVAEKYSPFNVNVTTIDPNNYNDPVSANLRTAAIFIGGDGAWLGASAGGVAVVGGYSNSGSNIGFAFSTVFRDIFDLVSIEDGAQTIAEATAHEAGHLFNLRHQSLYDASGTLVDSYYDGGALSIVAPTMGNSYFKRGVWWYGTTTSASTFQDDLAVLSSSTNQFGYRIDDHGGATTSATLISVPTSGNISTQGVIERLTDVDYFKFTAGAGSATIYADVVAFNPTLDLKLELRNSGGSVIAAGNNSDLGETIINVALSAGTYYLVVSSAGLRGDVGQYFITGQIPSAGEPLPGVPLGVNISQ